MPSRDVADHAYVLSPNRTLFALAVPVFFSLVAEPLTGLVDTAFVARLGSAELAALGVGTMTLSAFFWIFNFLGIGSQTEIARFSGAGDPRKSGELAFLSVLLGLVLGIVVAIAVALSAEALASAMGADGAILGPAATYIRIRALGSPAVLMTIAAFGVLRGKQDMRTPLFITVLVNALNIALDYVLIFGLGPVPAMGIAGAAVASVVSQWIGAAACVYAIHQRVRFERTIAPGDTLRLIKIGGDLFIRTGLLTLFLLLATRVATRTGADGGAAHQAIRQAWVFSALSLDALAITGQSLVGFFLGGGFVSIARSVAARVCAWSVVVGLALTLGMILTTDLAARILVPGPARSVFVIPWIIAAGMQPLSALSFATDGIHWGTGDFRYLRNGMVLATALGLGLLLAIDADGPHALEWVWWATTAWIFSRALIGTLRIWPGIGNAPLADPRHGSSHRDDR